MKLLIIGLDCADHGEEFMKRGNFGHGSSLYQEFIHVPLNEQKSKRTC